MHMYTHTCIVPFLSTQTHTHTHSGMLPGYVAGHYTYDDCHIDLAMLAQWAGVRFIHAEAQGLDLEVCCVCFEWCDVVY